MLLNDCKDVSVLDPGFMPSHLGQTQASRYFFQLFFISGFECSTFLWKDNRRRNLVADYLFHQILIIDDSKPLSFLYSQWAGEA